MNEGISWRQNLRLRQITTVLLMVITVLVMHSYIKPLPAQAETLIATVSAYQKADSPDTEQKIKNDNKLVERARRNLKENADIAKENLNLNEPIEDTKELLNSAQDSVKDAAKSMTQNNGGYYESRSYRSKLAQ